MPWRSSAALAAALTGFDVAGLAPGVGELFDGANALISLARGDPAGAALAAAAMIPGAGVGATSANLAARYGDEALELPLASEGMALLDETGWHWAGVCCQDRPIEALYHCWGGHPWPLKNFERW